MKSKNKVLIFVHHTVGTTVRSGIQRVVVELSRALPEIVDVDFVKWDSTDGQLRYLDYRDIDALFAGEFRPASLVNPNCHRVNYRFADTINDPDDTWLIFPEVPYLMPGGNEIMSRILSQCMDYRIRVAAVFYDLIPIREHEYAAGRADSMEYLSELVRCDRILAISKFSADDLLMFYDELAVFSQEDMELIRSKVSAAPLGEYRQDLPWGIGRSLLNGSGEHLSIVLLGTVEPRKQQTRFLRIFNDLMEQEPRLRQYSVEVIGSLHPLSASDLHREIARNPLIRYHQYTSDDFIDRTLAGAQFSVFVSKSEGYGLPIVESLRHGVPSLTTSFGPMAEIASGGGCLMTDALSDDAIARSLLSLVGDVELRNRLRKEISHRVKRSWGDYASDILSCLYGDRSDQPKQTPDALDELRGVRLQLEKSRHVEFTIAGVNWAILRISSAEDLQYAARESDLYPRTLSALLIEASLSDLDRATKDDLRIISEADVLLLTDSEQEQQILRAIRNKGVERLMPRWRHLCDRAGLETAAVGRLFVAVSKDSTHAPDRARKEHLYDRVASRLSNELPQSTFDLAIVISTFNRAPFTELNVGWLISLTRGLENKVCILVVDNASTDDTIARLQKFQSITNLKIHINSANVGMLGNLHVTSTFASARHIWTIGDDDFIRRGALERVLEVIRTHPRMPLIAHNFAVYHRIRLGDGESPTHFESESTPLCRSPRASGVMPIRSFAEEHDNLFTAIYPLVFRSDLAAACFNYPFDGIPFGDLVESVPTTKIVLESLADCEGYWISEIGITGNAHNSWSVHRPRWHLVLMPEIFYLARRRGLDHEKLWKWSQIHLDLFYESLEEARKLKKSIHLSETEIREAEWTFQRKIDLPKDLTFRSTPPPPLMGV